MELKEIEYENFGRCIKITNGILDCIVTIECGPRIVHFGFTGEKNIFYTDLERKYKHLTDESTSVSSKNSVYYLYGGHRLQVCRTLQTDLPDNQPVVYGVLSEGVTFTPPQPKQLAVQLSFEIIMGKEAADIMVVHMAKNCSRKSMILGLRPATLLEGGGIAVIPQNRKAQPRRPDRTINLWPETDINDARISYGNRFLTVAQIMGNQTALRIGTNNLPGWTAYAGNNFTFVKRIVPNPQAAYPDSGSSCEISLSEDFAELSSLSPMYEIKPGETIRHVENLSLYHSGKPPVFVNEDEIEKWAKEMFQYEID
ncbi:MAG: DUF1861 domain-containing protein [Oscillospiraceae bacterium]|jgi:hypothetical protein